MGGDPPGRTIGAVLCVADDPDVRAGLVGLAQELGAAVEAAADPDAARWCAAAVVLLDAGAAGRLTHLPRRSDVVLVCADGPDDGEPAPEVWRAAVAVGAGRVVVLPAGRGWLTETVAAACRPRGTCVAVVGARGGAGASSAAVALAGAAAAGGRRVLLLDADPLGGGLDLALGAEDQPGLRWDALHDLRAPVPPGGLAAGLPVVDGVVLLSYGRAGEPVRPETADAVVRAAADEHDLVVLDLPRAGDDAARAAAARADVVVCVCPCEVRAVAAAPAVLRQWAPLAPVHLLVRGPSPGGLRPREAAEAVRQGCGERDADRVQHVDLLRAEPGLTQALERGDPFAASPRSPLRRWATGWVRTRLPVGSGRAA